MMWNTAGPKMKRLRGTGKIGGEASVAARRGGESWGLRRLLLGPIGIEEIKDAANRPITYRDPENESNYDGEKQKERK